MTNTKKLTKMDKYAMLAEIPAVANDPVLSEFVAHEIELLSGRSSANRKMTPQQEANLKIKESIVEFVTASPNQIFTITEFCKRVPGVPAEMTNQRMTSLVTQLVADKKLTRIVEKGRAYFQAVKQ